MGNGKANQVYDDQFMYDLLQINTNVDSLKGIQMADNDFMSVYVSDSSISAMFQVKIPDPSNPNGMKVEQPINMYYIDTIEDLRNGLKKYTGSSSCCSEITEGRTDFKRVELVQTSDEDATLILTLFTSQ